MNTQHSSAGHARIEATMVKVRDAQPVGQYKPTEIDKRKAEAEFRILSMEGKPVIQWREGRRETVTKRSLDALMKRHTWATDF